MKRATGRTPTGRRDATLFLLACCAAAWSQPAGVDDKLVSVAAEGKPADAVLADAAKQVGAGIIFTGSENPPITLNLSPIGFGDCMAVIADAFALIIRWDGQTLLAQGLADAIKGAGEQLDAGRTDLLVSLSAVADGKVAMYGSPGLRDKLRAGLSAAVEERAKAVAANAADHPDAALALARLASDEQARIQLAVAGVRGQVCAGQYPEALAAWQEFLKGRRGLEVAAAGADLFLAYHYTRSDRAAGFWAESFDLGEATQLLQAAWRERAYGPGLTLARLNLQYASAAGRTADAQGLAAAIKQCLDSPRVIQVTCAVDCEATTDTKCEAKIRARVAALSEAFSRNFGISFSIAEFITWDPPSDNNYDHQYEALKKALGGRTPEFTIGFILEVIPVAPDDFHPQNAHMWTGYGCPHNGPYLLARDFSFENASESEVQEWTLSSGAVSETLIHEMAHMFGALHVDDKSSLMRPVWDQNHPTQFDETNKRIIMADKWQDMTARTETLDEPELLQVIAGYQEIATKSATDNGAKEEEAWAHLALAKRYLQRLEPDKAREQFQQVITLGVPEAAVKEAQAAVAG